MLKKFIYLFLATSTFTYTFTVQLYSATNKQDFYKLDYAKEEQLINYIKNTDHKDLDITISKKIFDKITSSFIKEYIKTFLAFPRSFFFKEKTLTSQKNAYNYLKNELCNGDLKEFCNNGNDFKEKILTIWTRESSKFSKEDVLEKHQNNLSYLNNEIRSIRQKYQIALKKHHSFLQRKFDSLWPFSEKMELNAEMKNSWIMSQPYQNYLASLNNHQKDHKKRALLTKRSILLIEGMKFDLESIDLHYAVAELKTQLKVHFLKSHLKAYLESNSSESKKLFLRKNHLKFLRKNISADHFFKLTSLPDFSYLSIPKVHSPELLEFSKKIIKKNFIPAQYVLRGELQKAIWYLKDQKEDSLAAYLEQYIFKEFSNTHKIERFIPLGGGFTPSYIVSFNSGFKGVYKSDEKFKLKPNRKDLFAHIASGYPQEIAASLLDRMLDLRKVPLTFSVKSIFGYGSMQYFVKNGIHAFAMTQKDISERGGSGKWSTPHGRSELGVDIQWFDWLIDNHDRTLDNYLYQLDGTIILIDHGFSFVSKTYKRPSHSLREKGLPSKEFSDKVFALYTSFKSKTKSLRLLLGRLKYMLFKKRFEYLVKKIRIEKEKNKNF